MNIYETIQKHRARSQKYTFKVIRSDSVKSDPGLQRFLGKVAELVKKGDIQSAQELVNEFDDFHRKKVVYMFLERGQYEEANMFLPEHTDSPPLIHLKMQVQYLLGADFDKLILMIKNNIERYKKMLDVRPMDEQREKDIKKAWATDLLFWGMFLALRGDYTAAIEKYDISYEIYPFPETLVNKYCCYNRSGDETNAYKTLKELECNHKDISNNTPLIEKIKYDVACDRFRDKSWFIEFLNRHSRTHDNMKY